MRHKNLDLIIVLLIAALNIGRVSLSNYLASAGIIIGIILALPLVFVLPGYTLTEALFKRTSDEAQSLIVRPRAGTMSSFTGSTRLVFSLGLSLVIDITTGLVLNILPMGLQQSSWAMALCFLTAVFSFIAVYRRQGMQGKQSDRSGVKQLRFRISLHEYILLGLALTITISSIWYSALSTSTIQQQQTGFTQLWMVSSKQANGSCAVLIGMQSFETSPTTYSIRLTANGVQLSSWSSVVLAPREEWHQSVPLTSEEANTITLDAQLYRTSQSGALYRETFLTLNSSEGKNGSRLQC